MLELIAYIQILNNMKTVKDFFQKIETEFPHLIDELSSMFDKLGYKVKEADENTTRTLTPGILPVSTQDFIKDELLKTKEFSKVKKINFLKSPTFITDKIGVPLDQSTEFIGDITKFAETKTFKISPGEPIEFSEEIDLYQIKLSIPVFDKVDIDSLSDGVWMLPPSYDDPSSPFRSKTMILVKLSSSNEMMQDLQSNFGLDVKDIVKKNIMKKIEDIIDKGTPNTPSQRHLFLRASSRSFPQLVEENKTSGGFPISSTNDGEELNPEIFKQ